MTYTLRLDPTEQARYRAMAELAAATEADAWTRAELSHLTVRTGTAQATALDPESLDAVMCRHVLAHNGGRGLGGLARDPQRLKSIIEEHEQLVAHLRVGDIAAYESELRRHLDASRRAVGLL